MFYCKVRVCAFVGSAPQAVYEYWWRSRSRYGIPREVQQVLLVVPYHTDKQTAMLALLWRSAQSSNTSHSKMSADVEAAKPGQDGSGKVAINKGMNDSRHRKRPSMKPTDFLQTAAEGPPLRRSLSADHLPLGHLPLVSTKIHQHATPEPRLLHP
jgi:hypothetical protein